MERVVTGPSDHATRSSKADGTFESQILTFRGTNDCTQDNAPNPCWLSLLSQTIMQCWEIGIGLGVSPITLKSVSDSVIKVVQSM